MADVNDPASPTYDPFGLRAGVRYSDADPGRTFAVEPGSGAGFSRAVAASPDLRQWLDDSLSHFGVKETPPNALLSQLLGQPLAPATGDFRYKFAEPLTYRDETNINLAQAVSHGFGTSFVGGLISLNKLQQAAKWEREPGYDVWADPQIKDAGLENQFELFHGSRSPGMTTWLISRYNQHQRDARVYQDMQGGWLKSGAEMVGGLLGDPTSYLPTTLGVKGASLALKGLNGELNGIEKGLVSLKKPIYGGLADGARAIAVQGAIIVGMNALREGYDPIDRIDQVSNDLFLPAAIAGSLGLLIGASGRYSSKLASLAADARKADFLHGTLPAGTRTFGDMTIEGARFTHPDFVGPVVPAEREAAESILSKADLRGETSQRIEAAKASIQHPNVGDGVLNPGALATDYGKIVKQEFGSRPENAHLVTPTGDLHPGIHPSEQRGFLDQAQGLSKPPDLQAHLKADAELDATGRPYTIDSYEARGERILSVDGLGAGSRRLAAADLPIGTTALDYNGVEWKIGQRGDEALWEVVSTNPKPRAGPKRLVNREFEPGELPAVDEPIAIQPNTIDRRGRDRVHDTRGNYLKASDLPEGQRLSDSGGNVLVVRNGVFYPEKIEQTPMVSATTDGRGWLPTREEQAAAEQAAAAGETAAKPQRLVDMTFKPGELERAEPTTTSEHLAAQPGLIQTPPRDLGPGMGTKGRQQAYALMPDGRIFEIGRDFKLTGDEKDLLAEINPAFGDHAALFARFPDLPNRVVRITRYEESIAGDLPAEGLTKQQNATLRRIEASWKREGLGDKAMFPTAEVEAPGSVGAALGPGSTLYREDILMAQGRQAPTGVGLEKLPTDPWARIALGRSVSAMRTMADLVSSGARQTLGNLAGITGLPPVEKMIEQIWNKPMADSVRHTFEQWSAYRKSLATMNTAPDPNSVTLSGRSDLARMREQLGTGIKDLMTRGEKPMSFPEFRDRVGRALNNADEDMVRDGASRYVDASAAFHRKTYNFARDQMLEHGVFDEAYSKALDHAHEQVRQIKKEADELKARANIERWPPGRERQAEEALMARMEDAEFKFKQQKDALDKLRANGPMLGETAKSYRPRIADVGEVTRREQEFVTRIADWLHTGEGGGHDLPEAARIAKEIHALYAKQNPIFERADAGRLFMSVAAPGSAMARSFTIPDKLIEDFLVNDSEVLMRYHMKQVGAAVEMKKRFGNLDLAEQVAETEQDYRRQIIAANQNTPTLTDPTEAQRIRTIVDAGQASLAEKASIGALTEEESKVYVKQLVGMMKSDIRDLQATRDKIYGTYGAAMDPSRWQSRLIRMAKQYTNLTLLGMSGITQLGDLMRPLMTEGMEAMYGYGFKTLMSESRATIARMTREELELMGDVSEMIKNVRALSVADTGDFFGNYGKFEHVLNKANQMFFVANGMNAITDMTKNWAATIIMGRVNKLLLDTLGTAAATVRLSPELATTADHELAQLIGEAEARIGTRTGARGVAADQAERIKIKGWQDELDAREAAAASRGTAAVPGTALSPADTARFAAAGIGPQEAQRIGLMLKIYHEKFNSLHMPNTTAWSDKEAAEIYRSAISQMVNRTVPVPGIGDRPNWMSTEWGSLIGQYKAFSVAAQIRQLQSGLQEGGSQFWYGAASMVGFAVVLNEIRSRLFYDKSTFDRPTTAVIADAVDRSSILGYFSDANRAIEALTGNRMGVKPMLGASQPRPVNWAQAAGQTLGPAAGQAVRAADVAGDFIAGHPTARTYANARTLTIGGSLPYLDPVMDRAISTGSYHQMAPVAHQLNQLMGVSEPRSKSPQRRAEPALQPAGGG